MTDHELEKVLVVPTSRFQALCAFQGFSLQGAQFLPSLLEPKYLSFRPRSEVETDPSYKQLIPYMVIRWQNSLFHYRRGGAGTESRLRAKRSVGVGGHINESDTTGTTDVYRAGLLRELKEELSLTVPYTERCLGLINDDSTPVGQVHLGIVHLLEIAEPRVEPRDPALVDAGLAPVKELAKVSSEFETWSQLVLQVLAQEGPLE